MTPQPWRHRARWGLAARALGIAVFSTACHDEPLAAGQPRIVSLVAQRAEDSRLGPERGVVRFDAEIHVGAPRGGGSVVVEAALRAFVSATGVAAYERLVTLHPAHGRARLVVEWLDAPSDAYVATLTAHVREADTGRSVGFAGPSLTPFAACSPERGDCAFASTRHACDLVGHRGDPRDPASAPANDPRANGAPLVAGIDLGYPVEHDGKLVVMFGDTITMDPVSGALVPLGEKQPFPLGLAPGNDDAMATVRDPLAALAAPARDACLDLEFRRDAKGGLATVSLDGPFRIDGSGGSFLGALYVGGGGFSAGGKLFALMPDGREMCRPGSACDHFEFYEPCREDGDCRETGDRCLAHSSVLDGRRFCFSGDDCAAAGAPEHPTLRECRPRRRRALLGVSAAGDERFELARKGIDVTEGFYEDGNLGVYGPELTVAAFAPQGDRIWVFGRSEAVGSPKAPSRVVLAAHDVSGGLVGPARYFAGCASRAGVAASSCSASTEAKDVVLAGREHAAVLFEDSKLVANKSFVAWAAPLDRWVMIYGGRLPLSFLNDPSGLWRLVYPTLDPRHVSQPTVGVYLRTAPHPWGPWSEPVTLYSAWSRFGSGYCRVLHYRGSQKDAVPEVPPEYLECDDAQNAALDFGHHDHGGEYAPALLAPLTQPTAGGARLWWLMSTWNPYRVVLMHSDISLDPTLHPEHEPALRRAALEPRAQAIVTAGTSRAPSATPRDHTSRRWDLR